MGAHQPRLAESWAGEVIPNLDVYDLSGAVARTEVRAMYGGVQMAIGIFALLGACRPGYRLSALEIVEAVYGRTARASKHTACPRRPR